jgi:cellulose biosynthesis protein BcsQ
MCVKSVAHRRLLCVVWLTNDFAKWRGVAEGLSWFGVKVFQTSISQRIIFAESAAAGKIAAEIEADHPGTREITELTNEIMELTA